jgi:hypothetical protein
MKALKDSWRRVLAWANRNIASIFTGWIVALIMAAIMIVKDMGHASSEIDHLTDKMTLAKENNELTQTTIMQFEMINDLLKTSASQRQGLDGAVGALNEQSALIQRLVDYLKSIGHWPPKIAPPKPTDPDKWI